MKISGHGRRRMEQRRISAEEVRMILTDPQWNTPGKRLAGRSPRINYWGRVKGRLIRVTITVEDGVIVSVVAPEEEGN